MSKYFVSPSLVEDHEYVVQVEITPDVEKLLSAARAAFAPASAACPSMESMNIILPKGTANFKICDPGEFGLISYFGEGDPAAEIRVEGMVFDDCDGVAVAGAVCFADRFYVTIITPIGRRAETEPISLEKVCGPVPPPAKEPEAEDKGFPYAIDDDHELMELRRAFDAFLDAKTPKPDAPDRIIAGWNEIRPAAVKAFLGRDFTNPEVFNFMKENAMLVHSGMSTLDCRKAAILAKLVLALDADGETLDLMGQHHYKVEAERMASLSHGRTRSWWEDFLSGLYVDDLSALRKAMRNV